MVSRVNRGCTKKQEKGGKMEKLEYSLFYQKFYIESNEHYDFVTLFRPLGTLLNSLYVLAVARAETRKDPLESPRGSLPTVLLRPRAPTPDFLVDLQPASGGHAKPTTVETGYEINLR